MAGKWGGTESLLSLLRECIPPPKKRRRRIVESTSVSCKMSLGGKGQNEEHWRASSFWTSSYSFFFLFLLIRPFCSLSSVGYEMSCWIVFVVICCIHTHTQRACTPEDIYKQLCNICCRMSARRPEWICWSRLNGRSAHIHIYQKEDFLQNKSVTLPPTNERKGGRSAASYLFIAFLLNKYKNKTSSYKFYIICGCFYVALSIFIWSAFLFMITIIFICTRTTSSSTWCISIRDRKVHRSYSAQGGLCKSGESRKNVYIKEKWVVCASILIRTDLTRWGS